MGCLYRIESRISISSPIDLATPSSIDDDEGTNPTANLLANIPLNQLPKEESIEVLRSFDYIAFPGNSIQEEGSSESSIDSISTPQSSSFKDSPLHSYHSQVGVTQISTSEIRAYQTSSTQVSSKEVDVAKVAFAKVDLWQDRSTQVSSTQINFNEVSLSSSITLQQFFSSHNFNLLTTTISTWTEFLQGSSPFNLSIEIKDLLAGQLADTQITEFDRQGNPIAPTSTPRFTPTT